MKSNIFKHLALAAAAILTLGGCREHIDEGSRYTFTGAHYSIVPRGT